MPAQVLDPLALPSMLRESGMVEEPRGLLGSLQASGLVITPPPGRGIDRREPHFSTEAQPQGTRRGVSGTFTISGTPVTIRNGLIIKLG